MKVEVAGLWCCCREDVGCVGGVDRGEGERKKMNNVLYLFDKVWICERLTER